MVGLLMKLYILAAVLTYFLVETTPKRNESFDNWIEALSRLARRIPIIKKIGTNRYSFFHNFQHHSGRGFPDSYVWFEYKGEITIDGTPNKLILTYSVSSDHQLIIVAVTFKNNTISIHHGGQLILSLKLENENVEKLVTVPKYIDKYLFDELTKGKQAINGKVLCTTDDHRTFIPKKPEECTINFVQDNLFGNQTLTFHVGETVKLIGINNGGKSLEGLVKVRGDNCLFIEDVTRRVDLVTLCYEHGKTKLKTHIVEKKEFTFIKLDKGI